MPVVALAIPILPGKTDLFRGACQRFAVDRGEAFAASRRRHGVVAERGFLQQTPSGDLAVVVFDVDDPARMLRGMATSDDALDVQFRAYLREAFGVDLASGAGPASEQVFEWVDEGGR